MKMLPEVSNNEIPSWLATFLRSLRGLCLRRFYGVPNRLEKMVTFQDLSDLGLVTTAEAKEQARKI